MQTTDIKEAGRDVRVCGRLSLQEIQAEELGILCEFRDYCDERGLRWSVAYGTLLGAVRHKGFIPWDDDVDVLMPREDYEKLLVDPLANEAAFTIVPGDGEPWLFAKLCSRRTRWNETYTRHSDRLGVFVDVFPWDGVGRKQDAAKSFGDVQKRSKVYHYAYSCDFSDKRYRGAKAVVQKMIGGGCRLKPAEAHREAIGRAVAGAKGDSGRINFFSPYPFDREYVPAEDCEQTFEVEFEGQRFPCIGEPERHLLRIYGPDWTTPVKHDEHLHGEAFWRDAR